jgi:hypothetical protein
MSVEYKAIYGYGYHITGDMAAELDEDKYEEFVESNYTHVLDGWRCSDDYFFGIVIRSADEGDIVEVPFKEYEHEDFLKMLNLHHYFFPNAPIPPRHYVINQVY